MAKRNSINPFRTAEFKEMDALWKHKLTQSGFEDLEDRYQNLKQYDIRTNAWENRESVLEFYLLLDRFMSFYVKMPAFDRRVMELYGQGYQIQQIVKKGNGWARIRVCRIINKYVGILQAFHLMESQGHETLSTFFEAQENRDSGM